jgi:peptide/nickel transport system permease protein
MVNYILRRLLLAGVTLLLITFVIYGLIRNMPGSVLDILKQDLHDLGGRQIDIARFEEMRKDLGLDRHWVVGYAMWIGDLARGDLGRSLIDPSVPVAEMIGARIGPTLLLSLSSLLLAWLISIPLGLYAGARSGGLPERTISFLLYMLYSLPSFVAALYLLILFSLKLDWLPLSGMTSNDQVWAGLSPAGKARDLLAHLVLPVACATYGSLAYYVRFIRSNLREVIGQDYIRTARAKGLPERTVVLKHAFRNTLIPLVTLLGLILPSLLSGSVILEGIFQWPGMGRLLFERVGFRDYPVIMALTLLFSVLVLAGNLLADLLYALVDPRIRYA